MSNLILHLPKTCAAVWVEETDGEIIVRLELPDHSSQTTASEARAAAAGLSADERKRAANAARQKRYRDRKRNAGVTGVTQNVTLDVTRNATPAIEGKNESILDDVINESITPINGIQEKNNQEILSFLPVQKSVTRNVTRRNAVTLPPAQEMIPFLPAGAPPELDLIHCPKLAEALEKYFEYRAFHGAPKWFPDYEAKFWQFVQSVLREFGEETAAEILDRNRRECRWFTLKVPPEMKLLAGPPPEPEPEPAYDAGPEISPEEAEEVSRSIKEYLECLRSRRVPPAVAD